MIDGLDFVWHFQSRKYVLETMAAIHYVGIFIILPVFCIVGAVLLIFTRFWWVLLIYLAWFWYDLDTPKKGSRPSNWFRNLGVWVHLRDYFPIKLEKTVEIDTGRNYLWGFHPHGLLGFGCYVNFATDVTGFRRIFPGLIPHPLTLAGQFWFPFRRDYIMLSGGCDCSEQSICHVLRTNRTGNTADGPKTGHVAILIVGGAEEALDAHPDCYTLTLKRRRGFVRCALKCGASLVPVFSFGENDCYDQVANYPGTLLRRWQSKMKNYCGFSPPAFFGGGFLNSNFGLLPKRVPITTIVGKPVLVEQPIEHPTDVEVERVYDRYVEALVDLFESNKQRFDIAANIHLDFY